MKRIIKLIVVSTLLLSFLNGCMKWEPGWKDIGKESGTGDVKALMKKAVEQEKKADSKEKLMDLINTYEAVVAIEPANHTALTALGNYYFLAGFAYTPDIEKRKELYIKAIKYSERGMYTNREFAALVDKGENSWEACRVLKEREMENMFYYYCTIGQYWTHCLNGPGRLLNVYWPLRTRKILDRMKEINENWRNGQVMFCYATIYTIPPSLFGGDMKKGAEYFKRAMDMGPDNPNYYVLRARYYYTKLNDREGFKKDLAHVLSLNPSKLNYPYPWGAYYRGEAKRMLDNIDEYF